MKSKFKAIFKRIIPISFINYMSKINKLIVGKKTYRADYKRFRKNAFTLTKKSGKDNLKAEISMHAHRLEKGLSYPNFREGFGKEAYSSLINAMNSYKEKYELDDVVYQTGLSVINEYIKKHVGTKIDTEYLENQLLSLKTGDIEDHGGILKLKANDVFKDTQLEFESFILSRHTVRDFSKEEVPQSKIEEALKIAGQTPSACNKQPWFTYVVKNTDIIKEILKIKGGLSGSGNIQYLLLITTDNNYLLDFSERKQGFIDAGMYGVTLLYALHYKNLAACTINARSFPKINTKIKKILSIPNSQDFIFFIAVGNYLEEFSVPKSKRDNYKAKTKIIIWVWSNNNFDFPWDTELK